MPRLALNPAQAVGRGLRARAFSSASTPTRPRHLMSIGDLTPAELTTLVQNAAKHKAATKSAFGANQPPSLMGSLSGKTIAMMFTKLSTRTRVSTEAAVAIMGGHPMFLGKNDIQLGVSPLPVDVSCNSSC